MLMNHRKMGLYQVRYSIPKTPHFFVCSESSSDEDFTNSKASHHHPAHIYKQRALDIQGYLPIKLDFQQTTHFIPACIIWCHFLRSAFTGRAEFFFVILCTGKHCENMRTLPCLGSPDERHKLSNCFDPGLNSWTIVLAFNLQSRYQQESFSHKGSNKMVVKWCGSSTAKMQ